MNDPYNDLAENYEETIYLHPLKRLFFARKDRDIRALCADFSGLILDAGSGTGRYGRMVQTGGSRVLCLDYSHAMLHQGRSMAKTMGTANIHFIQGTCLSLPLPTESLDAVIGMGIMAELLDQQPLLLNEILRVLKPGGRLVLNFNRPSLFKRISVFLWNVQCSVSRTKSSGKNIPTHRNLSKSYKTRQDILRLCDNQVGDLQIHQTGFGVWYLLSARKVDGRDHPDGVRSKS